MTDTTGKARAARRVRHEAIRAEVAQEEMEAVEADIAEKASALDVPMHLRIDRELDVELRRRAADEHVPTSALVRRLLRQAVGEPLRENLTAAEVGGDRPAGRTGRTSERLIRELSRSRARPSVRLGARAAQQGSAFTRQRHGCRLEHQSY